MRIKNWNLLFISYKKKQQKQPFNIIIIIMWVNLFFQTPVQLL